MAKVGRMVKEGMAEEFAKELGEQPTFFVTRVNRLTATGADDLRRKLHGSRARLVMVKRRISLRTLERLNLDGIAELLTGSVGFVLTSEEAPPVAKQLVDFVSAHEDQLEVRGAVVDGQVLDRTRVEALAKLPPKSVLLAWIVGVIESPLADVIWTIEQLIGDLAWTLEQASAKPTARAEGLAAAQPAVEAQPSTPATEPQAPSQTGSPAPNSEGQVGDTERKTQEETTP